MPPSPAHRIYNVVDDEAPDLATLFASVGAPPPDGSNAERARAFDALLDGRRIREDLGFKPKFPRLADAIAAAGVAAFVTRSHAPSRALPGVPAHQCHESKSLISLGIAPAWTVHSDPQP